MSKVLEELRYADSHEWVKVEGDIATVGITDYAQHALGNIVYVDMPEVGDEVTAGDDFGAVESVKAASDLISPISGEVVEINEALEDEPEPDQRRRFCKLDHESAYVGSCRGGEPSRCSGLR